MVETNAVSADFRKYDQVEKAHTYRLAEHAGDEFDEDYRIATLDIAPFLHGEGKDKARFAEQLVSRCSRSCRGLASPNIPQSRRLRSTRAARANFTATIMRLRLPSAF